MTYIAHKKEGSDEIQTVSDHCEGVAELSSEFGKRVGMSAMGKLAGLLHDAGKYAPSFQKYISGEGKYRRGEIDHAFCGAKYLCEFADRKGENYHVSRLIARVIVSHHGIHDCIKDDGDDSLQERISKEEEYDLVLDQLCAAYPEKILTTYLEDAHKEYCSIRESIKAISPNREQFAFYRGMLERTLQSILIDADRTNTADFCNNYPEQMPRQTENIWKSALDTLMKRLDEFDNTSEISRIRSSISERCGEFAGTKTGICQLIVPTGGGKTLSSLRFALLDCLNHGKERIFYVAPFMSILEQNSSTFREIIGEDNFLEHHSNVIHGKEQENELQKYELLTERWDVPMIATTMVQFMNTLFSNKMASVRRMHCLANSVIVIDEVQSIPVRCISMFTAAMNYLSKICGCTIVLCTATQPDFCWNDSSFQLLLDENPSMTGDYSDDFAALKRTEILPVFQDCKYSNCEIANFCYEKYLEERSVLLIVNTKSVAREVYQLLEERNKTFPSEEQAHLIHLSTNMCPKHRQDKIVEMKNLLKNGERIICVSTQLIEAGVDISFRCVIRSLAGLDRVAQAAGRCNRNGESAALGKVYVINAQEEKTTYMPEIASGKSIAERFFRDPSETEYLSPQTIRSYFRLFYEENRSMVDFPVDAYQGKHTLVELLSLNSSVWEKRKMKPLRYSAQAFKTAGQLFEMIDENSVSVIAPYDEEAKELILALQQKDKVDKEQLRQLQKYTIDIPHYQYQKLLENGCLYVTSHDIVILEGKNYNADFGMDAEIGKLEFLGC